MSDIQDWCKEILPVINAAASGESIQVRPIGGDCWGELRVRCIRGDMGLEYRIKPRAIKIGDFDVPEPMRNDPDTCSTVYYVSTHPDHPVISFPWCGGRVDKLILGSGMLHADEESAKIHARAIISLTAAK